MDVSHRSSLNVLPEAGYCLVQKKCAPIITHYNDVITLIYHLPYRIFSRTIKSYLSAKCFAMGVMQMVVPGLKPTIIYNTYIYIYIYYANHLFMWATLAHSFYFTQIYDLNL